MFHRDSIKTATREGNFMRHNLDRNNERVAIYNPCSGKATQLIKRANEIGRIVRWQKNVC